jgi:dTDP-L-oleandrosyltransferase
VSCATLSSNEHFSLIEKIVDVTGQRLPPRHPALTEFATRLLKLLAAHGQSHVSLEEFIGHTEGLHVAFFPRSFQYAGDTFDDRFVFVGPYLGDTTDASWAPPQDGTPLLVVTLGTSVSRNPAFFRTCALALGALPYRVLINVGSGVSENDLGALPPNVRVHGWLPLNTVLAHAAAYVCHAGMGSLMGAFVHGTPVVAVPHAPEQVVNAARVADLGLGRTLSHHEFTPERLRGAVREVVADPAIREQLAAMREDILTAGGGRRGADAIEQYMAVTGHAGRGARWT